MEITRETFDDLSENFQLWDNYSGRGMFGANCLGLEGETGELIRFAAALRAEFDDDDFSGYDLIDRLSAAVRSDSMGNGQIFYFPGVTVAAESVAE